MRILQIISSFPPAYSYGGALQVAFNISKRLVKNGHQVTVYTTDVLNSDSRILNINNPEYLDGIEIYRFKNISNRLASTYHISCAPEIANALENNVKKYDIIHCHEYRSFEAVKMLHYAKKYNVPYILQPHGSLIRINTKRNLKWLYDIIFGNNIVKNANGVIALNAMEADLFCDIGINKNKIHIIPNGIELSQYEDLPPKGSFKQKHNIPTNTFMLLSLGRLHPIKGVDLLIHAFKILSIEIENCILIIAGPDDGELKNLQNIVRELHLESKVIFVGPLYGKEKLAAYRDASIYILPSKYDAFPMTVIESMACGTPVVATTGCHISDIIQRAGIVVEQDSALLAKAIITLLRDEALRSRLSAIGKKMINEEFNEETVVKMIERVYNNSIMIS